MHTPSAKMVSSAISILVIASKEEMLASIQLSHQKSLLTLKNQMINLNHKEKNLTQLIRNKEVKVVGLRAVTDCGFDLLIKSEKQY